MAGRRTRERCKQMSLNRSEFVTAFPSTCVAGKNSSVPEDEGRESWHQVVLLSRVEEERRNRNKESEGRGGVPTCSFGVFEACSLLVDVCLPRCQSGSTNVRGGSNFSIVSRSTRKEEKKRG
jgi:hypothetical protein